METKNKKNNAEIKGFNFGGLFLGIVILIIGLFYLGRSTGIISGAYDMNILRLWPILIIYIGLSMIETRGWFGTVIGIMSTVLILAIVGVALLIGNIVNVNKTNTSMYYNNIPINISKETNINFAKINIKSGVGNIKIAGGANGLVEGSLRTSFMELKQGYSLENGVQTVDLETSGGQSWNWMHGMMGRSINELDIKINSDIPIFVNLDSGASNISADFSGIQLDQAEITSGLSTVDIVLGDKANNSSLMINAGLSSVKIHIPQNVGARLKVVGGMNSRKLDKFITIDDNNFESENYNSSDKKVKIETNGGMSNLEIDWR